jgi:hypothetical protein
MSQVPENADEGIFRAPTRREHWIATALFIGFAIFFVLLFIVLRGRWFRWVILGLGVWSVIYAVRHAVDARRKLPS